MQAEAGAWTVVGLAVAFLFHSILSEQAEKDKKEHQSSTVYYSIEEYLVL